MNLIHPLVDEQRWVQQYPLEGLREAAVKFVENRRRELPGEYRNEAAVRRHIELMSPKWGSLSTPESFAALVQLRWEMWPSDEPPLDAVPTDVFAWAEGEPEHPAATKVAGRPYWPKDREWPESGNPMYFVGQINFADSKDIVPTLPADLLCIFAKSEEFYEPTDFHFEWVEVTEQPLLEAVPVAGWWSANPVWGHRYRTWDHERFGIHQGTKIAGIPFEIQGPIDLPGTYLSTLHSVGFPIEEDQPMLNRSEPLTWDESGKFFGIGDAGSLYIFASDEGEIHAESACY